MHLYKNANIINLVWFVQFQDSMIEVRYVESVKVTSHGSGSDRKSDSWKH